MLNDVINNCNKAAGRYLLAWRVTYDLPMTLHISRFPPYPYIGRPVILKTFFKFYPYLLVMFHTDLHLRIDSAPAFAISSNTGMFKASCE